MKIEQLDLKRLRAFQLVARHGSLRVAAAYLKVTPAAVSIQISRLETCLAINLFERFPNKMILTASGERFLRNADSILEQAEAALLELAATRITGRLSISLGSDNSAAFAPIISSYVAQNPNVELSVQVYRSREALAALQSGELDLAIGIFANLPRGVTKETLVTTTLAALYQSEHPIARCQKVSLRDIASQRLIVPPRWTQTRRTIDAAFSAAGLRYDSLIEVINCTTAMMFAQSGVGVAIIHSSCVKTLPSNSLKWMDLAKRTGVIEISMAYRRNATLSPVVSGLLDALRRREL